MSRRAVRVATDADLQLPRRELRALAGGRDLCRKRAAERDQLRPHRWARRDRRRR